MKNENAFYLIYNTSLRYDQLPSSWNYDCRFEKNNPEGRTKTSAENDSIEGCVSIFREFQGQDDGKIVLETCLTFENSGSYMSFSNREQDDIFSIYTIDGFICVGNYKLCKFENKMYRIKIKLNLDTKKADVFINGMKFSNFDIKDGFANRLVFGTIEGNIVKIIPHSVLLYKNYSVNEDFAMTEIGTFPPDWEISGIGNIEEILSGGDLDNQSLKLNNAVCEKKFSPISGEIVFEIYCLMPNGEAGLEVAIFSENNEVFKILTEKNKFVLPNSAVLRNFTSNVWQCVRFEINTNENEIIVRIDGKKVGEFKTNFSVNFVNKIRISFASENNQFIYIDDVQVFNKNTPQDYVPEPKSTVDENYNVGINVCSLWKEGTHYGWDAISPFPDLEPILGYYDEGLSEVADWEIKFLVEHGIKFQHLCWYNSMWRINTPIKRSALNAALHDGFFNAKYADMMKFTFMWENSCGVIDSFEQFRDFLWPYWKEYYFTDSRFMVIDNKPIMTVWSLGQYIRDFGSEKNAKAATDFMREDIKTLGYDDIILLFADGHSRTKDFFDKMARVGADGTYGYHWNQMGKDATHQIFRMETHHKINSVHCVPTISVGFKNVGWSGFRHPLITPDGHREVARYIKNQYLNYFPKDSWKSKTLLMSTWNEFGEGTYTMPCEKTYGFAYLDTIREYFTNAQKEHIDDKPTENQKARLGYLYAKNRSIIKPLRFVSPASEKLPSGVLFSYDFKDKNVAKNWNSRYGVLEFSTENGVLHGFRDGGEGDIEVFPKEFSPIDISKVRFIHVKMKSDTDNYFHLHFKKQGDEKWQSAEVQKMPYNASTEFIDYYLDMTQNNNWDGIIEDFAVGPMLLGRGNFDIELIEFLYFTENEKPIEIEICGKTMKFDFNPFKENNEIYATINPDKGILKELSCYHEFSRFTKELYLAKETTEIIFTIGSNICKICGKELELKQKVTEKDGLIILPMKALSEMLALNCAEYENKLTIFK